jgi:20S proteasome subunit alpha 6
MNSTVGAARDRRKFKNNHLLINPDNILEILLRLVRGDRSGAAASVPIATSSLTGPLAAAVAPNNHYAGAQNHVSLAVVAMLKLTKEMADKAGVKSSVVDDRIADSKFEKDSSILYTLSAHLCPVSST